MQGDAGEMPEDASRLYEGQPNADVWVEMFIYCLKQKQNDLAALTCTSSDADLGLLRVRY